MLLAAGLLLTAATPVFAQAAVQGPGMFAFYHPNLDVLNGARRRPSTSLNRGQEPEDPIPPTDGIVLGATGLTIQQHTLSLATLVVGVGVNRTVFRDKGGLLSHACPRVCQFLPHLIECGQIRSQGAFGVDRCQSRARLVAPSV
jgi:hypothetical protein